MLVARLAALVLLLVVGGAALARAATLRGLAAGTTAHYLGLAPNDVAADELRHEPLRVRW
jgi:hypothetical protein